MLMIELLINGNGTDDLEGQEFIVTIGDGEILEDHSNVALEGIVLLV